MIELKIDFSQVLQLADDLHVAQDQVPFALSRTMNDAMFGFKENLSTVVWPRHVEQRNVHYPAAVLHISKASKGNLSATMQETRGTILAEHDQGATREGKFAIPMQRYREGKLTQHGLRADARLRYLLSKPNARRVVRVMPDGHVFVGKRGEKLQMAFVLKPSINVPHDVPISEAFVHFVEKYINDEPPNALLAAMKTRFK
jgi:hypothetical protein